MLFFVHQIYRKWHFDNTRTPVTQENIGVEFRFKMGLSQTLSRGPNKHIS